MSLFNPKTFSTDWEIVIIDKLERIVGMEKLMAFSGVLKEEFDLPVIIDWNALEIGMGVNASFRQFFDRTCRITDRASQLLSEYDLDMFPVGAHPMAEIMNSSHIHVGTISNECDAIRLESCMMKYAPVFGAIACNSPVSNSQITEFKSYRIRQLAHHCTRPISVRDPGLTQSTWGTDVLSKVYGHPTVEIRITDCASSRRLLAEMAVFIAAFTIRCGKQVSDYKPSKAEYKTSLVNRWSAAKYGLQASFRWDGANVPVVDIIREMMDECEDELRDFGVGKGDLQLLNLMLDKRTCQADFILDVLKRYPDIHMFTSVYSKLIRDWGIIDEYIGSGKPLDPMPVPDEDSIFNEHLAHIGDSTHFYATREAMWYSPELADDILERMIREGHVNCTYTDSDGMLLSRANGGGK